MAAVVVAEDEVLFRMVLAGDLEAAGHRVVALASSGEEAAAAVERENPDFAILDIHMQSKTDGIEACGRIRRIRPGVKIILMSGYPKSVYAAYLEEVTYDGYLEKVFSSESLIQLIAELS